MNLYLNAQVLILTVIIIFIRSYLRVGCVCRMRLHGRKLTLEKRCEEEENCRSSTLKSSSFVSSSSSVSRWWYLSDRAKHKTNKQTSCNCTFVQTHCEVFCSSVLLCVSDVETHTRTHKHAQTYTYTHTQTHTQTYTHTHTHWLSK